MEPGKGDASDEHEAPTGLAEVVVADSKEITMAKTERKYTDTERADAVKLALEMGTTKAAKHLELAKPTLEAWQQEFKTLIIDYIVTYLRDHGITVTLEPKPDGGVCIRLSTMGGQGCINIPKRMTRPMLDESIEWHNYWSEVRRKAQNERTDQEG